MKKMSVIAACISMLAATIVVALSGSAQAVSPAAFTTNVDGSAVNANHYAQKCDVYLNGGPVNAAFPSGDYTFAVMAPSGQADPNGPDLLSTDSNADRTFYSDGSGISYSGPHATSTDAETGGLLIDLCDYADTPNPGGVYILAVCDADNMVPANCKYDAFKVEGSTPPSGGTDLVATKTAAGSFDRTYSWNVEKDVDHTYFQTSGNTVTANYSVTVTKSGPVDSGFVVSGVVDVFNLNDDPATGVAVSDSIGSVVCDVTGGSSTIPAGGSTQFSYTCTLPDAQAGDSGTNTATVTWDASSVNSPGSSTTATAPYAFDTPTVTNDCTNVSDTLKGSLGTACSTTTYNYSLVLDVPSAGCTTYDNTASESTSGTSDSASVEVCRTNSDGFTMGFWQNKNGQKLIADHYAGVCASLAQYPIVLTGLPNPCTAKNIDTYVYNTVKAANAAGTGAPMFKGQFLATALSAFFSPSLASTGIAVDPSIFGTSCMTVSQLLAFGNANYATLSANKTTFMAVKDVYDNINNNAAVTC